jgi:hypothetical protein
MGFNPHADWIHATSPIPRVTLRLEQLKEAQVQAHNAMIKAQQLLRLVGRSVRRARGGVILKSTTNKGGLL